MSMVLDLDGCWTYSNLYLRRGLGGSSRVGPVVELKPEHSRFCLFSLFGGPVDWVSRLCIIWPQQKSTTLTPVDNTSSSFTHVKGWDKDGWVRGKVSRDCKSFTRSEDSVYYYYYCYY